MSISNEELDRIKQRVMAQMDSMDSSELATVVKSQESLTYYIAQTFEGIASALGYVIALPIAWVAKMVDSVFGGVERGWNRAFNDIFK